MSPLVIAAVALIGGIIGGILVDYRFWWRFVQEVYYHHPGNHLCSQVGCCR
jgi:hypothetical protein